MKKYFVIMSTVVVLILSISAFGCNKPIATEDHNSLVVMSYNIKTLMVDAEFFNSELSINNRNSRILDKITSVMPDIFGLQEALSVHNDYISDNLVDTYDSVITYRSDTSKLPPAESTAVYYKKDKFELLDSGTFWLSETPEVMSKGWDAGNYRICTYVKLKIKATDKVFCFYNTHLDFGAISVPESVDLILSRIDFDYPCILVGDFNFQSYTDYYQTITELMDDSRIIAEVTEDGATTNSFKTEYPKKIIDYCYLSKGDFTVSKYDVLDYDIEKYGSYASDHFPVCAYITFNDLEN